MRLTFSGESLTITLHGVPADRPQLPSGELAIKAPPRLRESSGASGLLMNALPMLASMGSVVFVATSGSSTPGGRGRGYLMAGMFLLSTLGFVVVQLDRQRRQRTHDVSGARGDYLHHLGSIRASVRVAAAQQRTALLWQHPDPSALPAVAEERSRVWERAADDPAFLQVRYAVCAQPLSVTLVAPDGGDDHHVDPVAASALRRLLEVHRVQRRLPATIDLRELDRIEVCGPPETARGLARAMVCSAAAFHSPEHLTVAVLSSPDCLADWDWVKWLPHARSARDCDEAEGEGPHVLLIVDGEQVPPVDPRVATRGRPAVTVLELSGSRGEVADSRRLRLQLGAETATGAAGPPVTTLRHHDVPAGAVADQCDRATAEALARRLTRRYAEVTGHVDLLHLLGLGDVGRYDPGAAWRSRSGRELLRVPIGRDDRGEVVQLDLKESAEQGMGPHGLVVGATGSGKSELLRTLVLALAVTHSPEQLNLVLVDFKGGATFAGMAGLPHVSAMITNLEQELTLVDRMHDALSGEMVRRQELLRDAGHHVSVRDYERARSPGDGLPPLPSLVIVVDEFSELLSAKPELLDLFVAIGRLGRSLGLHLLLASQRLEEGRLRGLESHLSYRVGLRTFSAQESRAVLGVPDAYELPRSPGLGFLKPDPATLLGFTAAYVSGPAATPSDHLSQIVPWTAPQVRRPEARDVASETRREPRPETLLEVAVGRMRGLGPAAHRVWLPPLDVSDTLDVLMPDLAPDPELGLVSRRWRSGGGLRVPIGTVDRPREQRRDTLTVDLAGARGHVAVVGGPRSGKSTLLRTLVTGLALTTTPLESQFYVLDFGGGTFAPMQELPHVAGVGTRSEPDVVRRIVAEVTGVVDRRERTFPADGIDSIETYRTRRERGLTDDGYGDVFLVVDGWSSLRADFDDLEIELQQLASRGLSFGFHLLTATARWTDYRPTVRDLLGTRLELRLGDPLDSEIDRKAAALVPPETPGRGLGPGGLQILAALPRTGGDAETATETETVGRIARAWRGPVGPKLRLLPELITRDQLLTQAGGGAGLLLGVDERALAPVGLDPAAEPHWLVFGDGRSGKTGALRTYLHEVMRRHTPAQAQLVVVDYRRSLLGEVPDDFLCHYLTSAARASAALADLASYLETRIPGHDVTAEQLRTRSWWTGAEVYVVVDDYDLVSTTQTSPVQSLQPLLAQAHDVGLHLVLARRSGGASRALYEPVIQSLRDLATPGLLLSGSPDEGPLIGNVRPGPAPPGRGRLITRDRGVEVVQLAWSDPAG